MLPGYISAERGRGSRLFGSQHFYYFSWPRRASHFRAMQAAAMTAEEAHAAAAAEGSAPLRGPENDEPRARAPQRHRRRQPAQGGADAGWRAEEKSCTFVTPEEAAPRRLDPHGVPRVAGGRSRRARRCRPTARRHRARADNPVRVWLLNAPPRTPSSCRPRRPRRGGRLAQAREQVEAAGADPLPPRLAAEGAGAAEDDDDICRRIRDSAVVTRE